MMDTCGASTGVLAGRFEVGLAMAVIWTVLARMISTPMEVRVSGAREGTPRRSGMRASLRTVSAELAGGANVRTFGDRI